MQPSRRRAAAAERGLSYVEVLVATTLLVVALVPGLDAVRAGIGGSAALRAEAERQQQLQSAMEEQLAQPFNVLYERVARVGDGSPLFTDAARRIEVRIFRCDGSRLAGSNCAPTATVGQPAPDTGLLRIQVRFAGGGPLLETLRGRWW